MKNCAVTFFLIAVMFCSCKKDKDAVTHITSGVFIVNEGNFNFGNAEISFYDPTAKQASNNLFHAADGSWVIFGGDVNQDGMVEVEELAACLSENSYRRCSFVIDVIFDPDC